MIFCRLNLLPHVYTSRHAVPLEFHAPGPRWRSKLRESCICLVQLVFHSFKDVVNVKLEIAVYRVACEEGAVFAMISGQSHNFLFLYDSKPRRAVKPKLAIAM